MKPLMNQTKSMEPIRWWELLIRKVLYVLKILVFMRFVNVVIVVFLKVVLVIQKLKWLNVLFAERENFV